MNTQLSALYSTDVRELQLLNASNPIDSTDLPMVMDIRPLHPSKALLLMTITLSGIMIEVRFRR